MDLDTGESLAEIDKKSLVGARGDLQRAVIAYGKGTLSWPSLLSQSKAYCVLLQQRQEQLHPGCRIAPLDPLQVLRRLTL